MKSYCENKKKPATSFSSFDPIFVFSAKPSTSSSGNKNNKNDSADNTNDENSSEAGEGDNNNGSSRPRDVQHYI